MKVHVEPDRCQGHGRCYSLAPDLFDADDLGMGSERNDGMVAPQFEDDARKAFANCPEYAINLTESP